MKKLLLLITVGLFISLGLYSVQSTSKKVALEDINIELVTEEINAQSDSVSCCTGCSGRYCGYFAPEWSPNDKISFYYE